MTHEKEEVIRSFVAINLPYDIKKRLFDVSIKFKGYLRDHRTRISWISTESIHLTLKFLGSIEYTLTGPLIQRLEIAARDYSTFKIQLDEMGVFPNQNRPRVVWVGVGEGAERICSLQGSIERGLSDLGFESEKREFSPHLTLGRIKGLGSRGEVLRALRALQDIRIGEVNIEKVSLMKSTLTPKGAIYTELGSVALKKG